MPRLPAPRPPRSKRFKKKTVARVTVPMSIVSSGAPGAALATRGFRGSYGRSVGEKKFYDIATAQYGVNTNGSITLLCYPVLGSDYNQRIGRKIIMKSIYIRGLCGAEASQTTITTPVNSPGQLLS